MLRESGVDHVFHPGRRREEIIDLMDAAGDDIQALKTGILEIADILVVNKADQPLATNTASQMRNMLALLGGGSSDVPVLLSMATRSDGVPERLDAIARRSRSLGGPHSG